MITIENMKKEKREIESKMNDLINLFLKKNKIKIDDINFHDVSTIMGCQKIIIELDVRL